MLAVAEKPMIKIRAGEQGTPPTRSSRFYKRGKYWYFRTREGAPIGPFDRLSEAIAWSNDYIEYLRHAPSLSEVLANYS